MMKKLMFSLVGMTSFISACNKFCYHVRDQDGLTKVCVDYSVPGGFSRIIQRGSGSSKEGIVQLSDLSLEEVEKHLKSVRDELGTIKKETKQGKFRWADLRCHELKLEEYKAALEYDYDKVYYKVHGVD